MKHRKLVVAVVVAALIAIAVACRYLAKNDIFPALTRFIRPAIYISLLVAWGYSIHRRIIQPYLRRCLMGIVALMVFWMVVRTCKFELVPADWHELTRLLWYSYYIPMMGIPLLSVLAADSIGKPEDYHPPRIMLLYVVPTFALAILVLTNDFHQLVFAFRSEEGPWSDVSCSHEPAYWVVFCWIAVCAFEALWGILRKSRIPHKKILWLPLVPLVAIFVYSLLYVSEWPLARTFFGDMTVILCLLTAAVFESCIQSRIIMSNSHYDELFQTTSLPITIVDESLDICYASSSVRNLDMLTMRAVLRGENAVVKGARTCAAPIHGGYVFWQEDVTRIIAALDELSGIKRELQSYGDLIQEENAQKKRARELEERKRLFDAMQRDLAPHLKTMNKLAHDLQHVHDVAEGRKILLKVTVLGAYLKRRGNLILLADQRGRIPAEEIFLCLKEVLANIRLCGATCALSVDMEGTMNPRSAYRCLDFFEEAIELSWDSLSDLAVFVIQRPVRWDATLLLRCDADMTQLAKRFPGAIVEKDDGAWHCDLTLTEGGTRQS